MKLKGSCHCGAVKFTVDSHTPQPFMRCYCSICRKTAGGGGYAINIMGETATLKVTGARNVGVYRARIKEKGAKRGTRGGRELTVTLPLAGEGGSVAALGTKGPRD